MDLKRKTSHRQVDINLEDFKKENLLDKNPTQIGARKITLEAIKKALKIRIATVLIKKVFMKKNKL